MGKRYSNDYSEEELRRRAGEFENVVTIPVNVEVKADHRVLDLGEVEGYLKKAKRIGLQDCECRLKKGNCNAPRDVCISIDPSDDYLSRNARYRPRLCTLKEALDALRRSHEAGLVHMAYTMRGDDRATVICSCCPCCCHTLGGLLRFGIASKVLTSKFVAEENYDKCLSCGRCVDRCVFGARSLEASGLVFDSSRCFGCGLCVSTCPAGAITLKHRA
jgi:NAD-dependent dihydropyrimidine dehydrogenase PreA subunit/ferredoxin-thioredoxin reductase catalytic subunit